MPSRGGGSWTGGALGGRAGGLAGGARGGGAVRLPEPQRLPRTLSLERVAGDRLPAAVAGSVLVRAAGEHGDADRAGAGAASRGCRLLGAADRDRAAGGWAQPGAVKGRRAGI